MVGNAMSQNILELLLERIVEIISPHSMPSYKPPQKHEDTQENGHQCPNKKTPRDEPKPKARHVPGSMFTSGTQTSRASGRSRSPSNRSSAGSSGRRSRSAPTPTSSRNRSSSRNSPAGGSQRPSGRRVQVVEHGSDSDMSDF